MPKKAWAEISTLQEPGWPHLHRCEEPEGKRIGEGCEAGGKTSRMNGTIQTLHVSLVVRCSTSAHPTKYIFNEDQQCQRHWLTLGSWWKKYHNSIKILWSHSYMVLVDCYGLPWWDISFICSNSPGSGGKALEKCSKVGCPSKICPLAKSENFWPGKCSMYVTRQTGIKRKEAM